MTSLMPTPIQPPDSFPFVAVSGAPRERGLQYGKAVPDRIRRSIALYGGTLDELGLDAAHRQRLIGAFADHIARFGAHYLEEMRGIAEGAGVPLDDIILINARTEVVAQARRETNQPEAEDDVDGCTGAVILPERSASGHLIHGQNWDWRAECAETAIVLRVARDDGPDFVTFVEAGGLARCGFNQAGIAITANYIESDRDYREIGVPLVLIRRKVLEQKHFALALRVVAATPKTCSNNMMVSSAEGYAIDFECAPEEVFPLYPEDGLLVHANHWVSPVALAKLKDAGLLGDSFYRDKRVARLLDKPKLTTEDLKAAFFDDFAAPFAVCRPVLPNSAGDLSATVAMIVMDAKAGYMDVAPLPAHNRDFTRYSLHDAPVSLARAAE
ncbi:acyl-CoA:6-aminopenicillanic acid acyl transferase [Dongia mobilis]|uniref:Acyl-CoA:6-aminopenicillanic acid acyl transferase n=1 Tax=Dongia mobilis TaxID=578943 RepID=A0A4R6WQZ2_9PROT|nr:C45 family peptidase [Dongia mobilis]TDQ83896.1 acyl-CoA:6-aminopenicillanic acid acyl transferase [Dongia mobilis]